jgi:hypothetical protein
VSIGYLLLVIFLILNTLSPTLHSIYWLHVIFYPSFQDKNCSGPFANPKKESNDNKITMRLISPEDIKWRPVERGYELLNNIHRNSYFLK